MNSFEYMVQSLNQVKNAGQMINKDEYEIFCKEYIFERLKGFSFGNSFCKRFDIVDYLISNVSDDSTAKLHIEQFYIK